MSEKIPILFMHHVSMLGGAERYMVSVIDHLDKKFQPFCVVQDEGPLTDVLRSKGVELICIQMRGWRKIKYWLRNKLTVAEIARYAKKHNIKLIFNNAFRLSGYANAVAKKIGVKCLSVLHDCIPIPKLGRYGLFGSDEIVTVSQNMADSIQDGYSKKVRVIYNGLDQRFLDEVPNRKKIRDELRLTDDLKLVGTIGNMIPNKNQRFFLRCMDRIHQEFGEARFMVVGDELDPDLLTLDELKDDADRFDIGDVTTFIGYREDINDLIAAMDIFVLSSDQESFGRVLIEAMALGKPVVSTKSGGPEEIVDESCGYLVDIGDETMFTDGVRRLLIDEKERAEKGEAGAQKVKEKFLLDQTVTEFNSLIESMLV